jgi:capsular polysaccharide biosynthesis protein
LKQYNFPMSLKQLWYRNKVAIDKQLWAIGQKVSKPIKFEKVTLAPAPSPVLPTPPANRSSLPTAFDYPLGLPIPCPGEVIYQLHDVHVAWHGTVVKGLRVFVPSLPYPFLEPELSGTFLLRQLKSHRVPQLTGTVGLIFDQWSIGNYFHWIAEVLPRLALLRKYQPDCTVLLPGPNPPAFIKQTVEAFGFTRTYIMASGEMIRVDNLLVAALPGFQGYITPSLVRESRDIVLAKLAPHTLAGKKPTRKVYVSRSLQKWRQLTNEAEVVAMLTNHGFETVYFEHLSFVEQIKLMRETQVFIGIHGANMTNILFMPAGGYVVEIMSEGYMNLSYLHMSNSVGLNYSIVPSTVGSPSEVFHTYADITTNVKLVEEIIKPICEAVA